MSDDSVTACSSLEEIYGDASATQSAYYASMKATFEEQFACAPDYFARAPGRVNLIGEHIDYHGYAVLPMAIEQDIVMAVAPRDDARVVVANMNEKHCAQQFDALAKDLTIDKTVHAWTNYVLAGFKGVLEHFNIDTSRGANILVGGRVPPSAGLSSSSALVCCSALALARLNNSTMSRLEFASLCTTCEKYVGTEGGGMDQSISFLASAGQAKYISFRPLKAESVALPIGATFVIANSLVEANKVVTAGTHFNKRVVEGRLAAALLAHTHVRGEGDAWKSVRTLKEAQTMCGRTLEGMAELVRTQIKEGEYALAAIASALGLSEEATVETYLCTRTQGERAFRLHDRAVHVYTEALRVEMFREKCASGDEDTLQSIGRLMNESHASCSAVYECSCVELDTLTAKCRELGALGSRLTGAGWGGCSVSLIESADTTAFLGALSDAYFTQPLLKDVPLASALFASRPGSGAAYYTPQ